MNDPLSSVDRHFPGESTTLQIILKGRKTACTHQSRDDYVDRVIIADIGQVRW